MDTFSLNQDQTTALWVLFFLTLIFGLGFWRRRQNIRHNTRHMVLSILAGGVVYWFFQSVPNLQPAAPIAAGMVSFLLYVRRPSRKRSMRADVRRRVVAKWVASTGKKYDSRTHEIDHIVPYSKGGGETEDNLRVIEKKKNRSKGARGPWWDVMGR